MCALPDALPADYDVVCAFDSAAGLSLLDSECKIRSAPCRVRDARNVLSLHSTLRESSFWPGRLCRCSHEMFVVAKAMTKTAMAQGLDAAPTCASGFTNLPAHGVAERTFPHRERPIVWSFAFLLLFVTFQLLENTVSKVL